MFKDRTVNNTKHMQYYTIGIIKVWNQTTFELHKNKNFIHETNCVNFSNMNEDWLKIGKSVEVSVKADFQTPTPRKYIQSFLTP